MDYATIVHDIQDYDHEDARELRGAVRRWASGFPDSEERMDIWSGGWKEGYDVGRNKRGRSVTSEGNLSNFMDKSVVMEDFGEGQSDNSGQTNKENTHTNNSENKTKLNNRTGNKDVPQQNESSVIKIHTKQGSEISKIREQKDKDGNKKNTNQKDRQKLDHNKNKYGNNNIVNSDDRSDMSKDKGSGARTDSDSGKSKRSINEINSQTNKRQKTSELDELYDLDYDIVIGEETENEMSVDTDVRLGKYKRCDILDKENDKGNNYETDLNNNITENEINENIEINETNKQVKVTTDKEGGNDSTNRDSRIVHEIGKVVDKTNDDTDDSSSTLSSSSQSSTEGSDLDSACCKALRDRATKLLTKGVMPLCPPARRIWTRSIDVEVNGINLSWPPSNWRELSPENRLFAMEQMALTLERKSHSEFPIITKKLLCDKYAFLMLEGQDKPVVSEEESEKVPDKIRQYNFLFLRGIVRGDIQDSRQAWSIVKSLERADRWTDADEFINVLETGGIHIKI